MVGNIYYLTLPRLVRVVPQIEPVPLLVGVDVQGGDGAEDLLEGEEGGGDGLGLVVDQLLAGHAPDLNSGVRGSVPGQMETTIGRKPFWIDSNMMLHY